MLTIMPDRKQMFIHGCVGKVSLFFVLAVSVACSRVKDTSISSATVQNVTFEASIASTIPIGDPVELTMSVSNESARLIEQVGQYNVLVFDCVLTDASGERIPYTSVGAAVFGSPMVRSPASLYIVESNQSRSWQYDLRRYFESLSPGSYRLSSIGCEFAFATGGASAPILIRASLNDLAFQIADE